MKSDCVFEQKAKELMSHMFGLSVERLKNDASLVDDLDIDSIDMIDLLGEINKQFELELDLLDFSDCVLLGDLLKRLKEKVA